MIAATKTKRNTLPTEADFLLSLENYCQQYDVDFTAALAVAAAAGLNGNVSADGYGYGPFWLDLRNPDLPQLQPVTPYNALLNTWAWSNNGIQYAVRRMWKVGASGKTNGNAIAAILEALYGDNVTEELALDVASIYVRMNENPEQQARQLSQLAVGPSVMQFGVKAAGFNQSNLNATLTGFENIKNSWAHKIPKFSADMTNIGKSIEKVVK